MYGAATNTAAAMYPDGATTRADDLANAGDDAKSPNACQCSTDPTFIQSTGHISTDADSIKRAGYAGTGATATPLRSCKPRTFACYADTARAGNSAVFPGSTGSTKCTRSTGNAVYSKQWMKDNRVV